MCPAERERDATGCRASGRPITPELPVLVLVFPPLIRLQALVMWVQRQPHLLLFPGLLSDVSSSPAVVVTKKLWIILVPSTALSSLRFFHIFFATPQAYRRGRKSGGYIAMKLNKTNFNSSRDNSHI